MKHVIVIGGGAAGCMAAVAAAQKGAAVTLLERNPKLGRKLYITGKGRCNVTNDCAAPEVLQNVPRNSRFLTSAVTRFPPEAVKAFFEGLGVPLKTERGNRVFPCSDKAADIIDALLLALRRSGVHIVQDRARALRREGEILTGVEGERGFYPGGAVVIATGGVSYPLTGSTGDGYALAVALGHTILPPRGSLVPLVAEGDACAKMQGLSLRNVAIQVRNSKKKTVYAGQGELLFTHFGLSGPLILSASAHMRDFDTEHYYINLDLKPALDEEKLDRRLLRDFEENANRDFHNVLEGLVPRLMVPVLVERTGIPAAEKVHSVTKAQRRRLLEVLKCLRIDIQGPRPVEEAIVTSGGIKVSEINPTTLESKKAPGVYFAGEVLDVDAYTGGFNLQIAWSTGHAAGEAAAQDIGGIKPMTKHKSIAVDGPSGAGKSTLAKLLARRLGFLYVDTGAIYRTVGLRAYRAGVDPEDEAAVTALLDGLDIELKYGADGLQHMYLDGEDVTDAIRQHVISRYTSGVSAIPAVRAFLLERQRDMAREHDVIMDGRDIGTVVLPGADVKIFLTASPEDRARRRFDELRKRGQEADYDTVLRDIILRDEHDTRRSAAPLRQAKDALLVDTTGNSLDESLDVLLETIKERLKA